MAEWTPDLTLNHDLLDEQHVAIFRRLGEAVELLGGPAAQLVEAVAVLSEALVAHLATEEQIMEEALYPERSRHRSAHELFMADFQRMRDELRREGETAVVAEWLRRRLPEWLGFHIRVNDRPLGAFLSRRRALGTEAHTASRRLS